MLTKFCIFTVYILILLWIDINLLEVKPYVTDASSNILSSKSELLDDSIEPGNIFNYC